MKPKKVKINMTFDPDVAKFLKSLSKNREAAWFTNKTLRETEECKEFLKEREKDNERRQNNKVHQKS